MKTDFKFARNGGWFRPRLLKLDHSMPAISGRRAIAADLVPSRRAERDEEHAANSAASAIAADLVATSMPARRWRIAAALVNDLVNQASTWRPAPSSTTGMPASSAAPAIVADLVVSRELDHGHVRELCRAGDRRCPG